MHKGGTSSIKCTERICKEGELGISGIRARLDILVISKIGKVQYQVMSSVTKKEQEEGKIELQSVDFYF